MSILENAGRCPRCHAFVIAEQLATHTCRIPTKGAKRIFLDWLDTDSFLNQNGDSVRMAKGLNGTLYSLVVCKHNPPHRASDDNLQGNRSDEDFTAPWLRPC